MSQRSQLPATLQAAGDETNLVLTQSWQAKTNGTTKLSWLRVTDEWISIRYAWNALKGSFHPFNNLSISTLNLRSSMLTVRFILLQHILMHKIMQCPITLDIVIMSPATSWHSVEKYQTHTDIILQGHVSKNAVDTGHPWTWNLVTDMAQVSWQKLENSAPSFHF